MRLDSPTATPVGGFAIGNTGGRQSWRAVPTNMTGTHDVHVTFTGGRPAEFVGVNRLKFARDPGGPRSSTTTPRPAGL
ncbi:carbohydrate-binding protein [Actinosynnema sp. NPDC053489]|uniref:carbohydrate-binding protein n=1 Tax=Actinosynnema sp. NPDC053489 TaxID=3363916 RepID=UPI0037C885A8